jgi:hypothetical protein
MPSPVAMPDYLEPYVVRQDPSLYTPMDHAGWRYILKISKAFFPEHEVQKAPAATENRRDKKSNEKLAHKKRGKRKEVRVKTQIG